LIRTITDIVRVKQAQIVMLIAFSQFFLLRVVPWPRWLPVPAKYADADIYINAGNALLGGALPGSVNEGHPPLAEYIIGFFSVYLKNPNASAIVFGFLTAILAFLIARRLAPDLKWSALAVWILAVDQVNISLSIRPMLEIFMVFFGILGLYLILTSAGGSRRYLISGLSFGFALACKLTAVFFVAPVLLLLVCERKLREWILVIGLIAIGYVIPYSQLLLTKGLEGFSSSQVLMLNIQYGLHIGGVSVDLLTRILTPLIVHTTTLAPVTGYAGCPPNFLGLTFASIAESVNAPLLLLLLPVLFWLLRNHTAKSCEKRRTVRLLVLAVISFMTYEAIFPTMIAAWYFAPIGTLIAIAAPAMLADFQKRSNLSTLSIYLYLAVLSTWLVWANSIYLACM
jgi:4-amino-4-deoxy-L-arabinose transferase-like glycosyltransferase